MTKKDSFAFFFPTFLGKAHGNRKLSKEGLGFSHTGLFQECLGFHDRQHQFLAKERLKEESKEVNGLVAILRGPWKHFCHIPLIRSKSPTQGQGSRAYSRRTGCPKSLQTFKSAQKSIWRLHESCQNVGYKVSRSPTCDFHLTILVGHM